MSVEVYGGGVKSTLKNPVEYGGYVMDPTEQAQIHQGAWATTRKVLEEQRQKIVGFFTAARDRIVQRLNA